MDFIFMSAENEILAAESSKTDDSVTAVETTSADALDKAPGADAKSDKGKEQKQENKARRRAKPAVDQVVAWFAACARCSFFLSAYRLDQGNDELIHAAENSKAGWLSLTCSQSLCKLVRKSYGSLLDIDCYHYDGSCPDCRRQFVYHGDDGEDGSSARFRIELKPRAGR